MVGCYRLMRTSHGVLFAVALAASGAVYAEPAPEQSSWKAEIPEGMEEVGIKRGDQPNFRPRDSAVGQETGKSAPPGAQQGQQLKFTFEDIIVSDAVDPKPGTAGASGQAARTSGQATAINSPRDPATGQATSVVQSGHGPGSGTAGESFHIEVDGASGGYVSSDIGGSDDGQSMHRKPPRNKTRKGRRMHKP